MLSLSRGQQDERSLAEAVQQCWMELRKERKLRAEVVRVTQQLQAQLASMVQELTFIDDSQLGEDEG